jgi:prevent-host-death family protein
MTSMRSDYLPLAEVKNRLSEVVDSIEREHGRAVITKHGRPAAIVLSIADLEGLEETVEIMSDPALAAEIQAAIAEKGDAEVLTKEEALARFCGRDEPSVA